MILDMHIHVETTAAKQTDFLQKLKAAGVDGGVVLSSMPLSMDANALLWRARLKHVLEICKGQELLFPFFFIDPTEIDAEEQARTAISSGIAGFKIICTHFYPGDASCLDICNIASQSNKPVLFHSGILWNGAAASGTYNRPINFEPLLSVHKLRFALAHISWPWCDECIAVYGKWQQASKGVGYNGAEMFIDNTPGTPRNYRKDALEKLVFTGYDVLDNLVFGTDNLVETYDVAWAKEWIERDCEVYKGIGISEENQKNIFANNLLRFIHG